MLFALLRRAWKIAKPNSFWYFSFKWIEYKNAYYSHIASKTREKDEGMDGRHSLSAYISVIF